MADRKRLKVSSGVGKEGESEEKRTGAAGAGNEAIVFNWSSLNFPEVVDQGIEEETYNSSSDDDDDFVWRPAESSSGEVGALVLFRRSPVPPPLLVMEPNNPRPAGSPPGREATRRSSSSSRVRRPPSPEEIEHRHPPDRSGLGMHSKNLMALPSFREWMEKQEAKKVEKVGTSARELRKNSAKKGN